ncbi:hypothetical protein HHI36_002066 [Cryptolaemus montrouzieri]|uniref:Uncharacterized protein n=1 Tax=Cryptolaemus montrouzieri TaxID=559131 RepID=A0ABD2PA23_9CUCU
MTDRRVRYVRDSLVCDGKSPTDERGRNEVLPHKLSDETKERTIDFIENHKLHYESFRSIFENNFNISFDYPRKDTCSTCDTSRLTFFSLTKKSKSNLDGPVRGKAQKEQDIKLREKELYFRRSERFYQLNGSNHKRYMKSRTMEAITMDNQKTSIFYSVRKPYSILTTIYCSKRSWRRLLNDVPLPLPHFANGS